MSIINTISGVSSAINVGGSALSLVAMGRSLIKPKKAELKKGIEGFLFDINLTESVTYNATITDHFVEDNSAMQDHIAFDPVKITITGKVAELVHTRLEALAFLSAAIDRLSSLGLFSPEQGLMATKMIASLNQANSAYTELKKGFSTLSDLFSDTVTLNKQQLAFKKFTEYFETRSLISVETPWNTYDNMAIESFTADQGPETNMETTFTLNFKQVRFVSSTTNQGELSGRIQAQKAEVKNKGVQTGQSKGSILGNTFFPEKAGVAR